MKITSTGQVTIPAEFRQQFGLLPNTEVEFIPGDGGVKIVRAIKASGKGRKIIERLRGRGNGRRSTDDLLNLTRSEV